MFTKSKCICLHEWTEFVKMHSFINLNPALQYQVLNRLVLIIHTAKRRGNCLVNYGRPYLLLICTSRECKKFFLLFSLFEDQIQLAVHPLTIQVMHIFFFFHSFLKSKVHRTVCELWIKTQSDTVTLLVLTNPNKLSSDWSVIV